ncbi:uncharacterized protein LOC26527092 [Drosophila erecta]|uniref:Uncharacterized protein n=1 Tax=Drosophila erecta TaxID=7220 RepID=A0A0Q5U508_DROER|nr:uncharacterized protein LOC26527092 [Drosophila erecta]KQS44120.1 uncharacterized protein Dere_GG27268 [Drosophila erecta]
MLCYIYLNLFCVLLLVDLGQSNLEYADYIDPEADLDYHLTRPDVADSDNEMTTSYDYHHEIHDSTNHPDTQAELSTETYDESHYDHLTTRMNYFPGSLNDKTKVQQIFYVPNDTENSDTHYVHHDPHVTHEIDDRIARYALHKWHEEI